MKRNRKRIEEIARLAAAQKRIYVATLQVGGSRALQVGGSRAFSDPRFDGAFSDPRFDGAFSDPRFDGAFSDPRFDGAFSAPRLVFLSGIPLLHPQISKFSPLRGVFSLPPLRGGWPA